MINRITRITLVLLVLQGCAAPTISKNEAFPQMYAEKPIAILVLPAINRTTASDAPILYSSTINEPLSNAGFYVLPIEATDRLLRNEGLTEGEMFVDIPPQRFAEPFGADAVLYVIINLWDTNYFVLGGNVTVAVEFDLKSTRTGERLWGYTGQVVIDTSGDDSGGFLAQLVATAISTAAQDYVPIARQVNLISLQAIPFGKYHNSHDKDRESPIPMSNIPQ